MPKWNESAVGWIPESTRGRAPPVGAAGLDTSGATSGGAVAGMATFWPIPWDDRDVPTHLPYDAHLTGLRDAMVAFGRYAEMAGLETDVPTCPDWTVRRLIGHQGMVHRWARACLRGENVDAAATERAGRRHASPVDWLRDGAIDLVTALNETPADADALVFLHDAPPARLFWVRRQGHETTMHAVDALAAALGRVPRAEETWIDRDLALDGIDELVLGFVPRSTSRLRSADPVTIALRPTDADHSWSVRVTADGAPVSARHDGRTDGDLVAEASSVALYLALWHRTDEVASDIWPLWHDSAVH